MRNSLFTAFVATCLLIAQPFLSGREFTDTSGRKITADIVSYTADSIEIKMGTKTFSVSKDKFSEADNDYIKEWITKNPGKAGYRFRVFVSLDENYSQRSSRDGVMVTDKLKTRPHNYNIVVYNQSKSELSDINIRYEMYVNDVVDIKGNRYAKLAVGVDKIDKLQAIPGKLSKLKIPGEGKVEFEHNFDLHNYVDRDGGKVDQAASDKVIGVRVQVYMGESLLYEHVEAEDDKRMEGATWQNGEAKEETPVMKK